MRALLRQLGGLGMVFLVATPASATEFAKPVRLRAGKEPVRVEPPGYAFPCLADLNGDGKKDLLVGQFRGGKIKVYPGLGNGEFGKGKWLQAGGKDVQIPEVW